MGAILSTFYISKLFFIRFLIKGRRADYNGSNSEHPDHGLSPLRPQSPGAASRGQYHPPPCHWHCISNCHCHLFSDCLCNCRCLFYFHCHCRWLFSSKVLRCSIGLALVMVTGGWKANYIFSLSFQSFLAFLIFFSLFFVGFSDICTYFWQYLFSFPNTLSLEFFVS